MQNRRKMHTNRALFWLSALCLLLAVLCTVQAIAWVQASDAIVITGADIVSSSRGVTGGVASDTDLNNLSYELDGSSASVNQGYVPGDRKYFYFVINLPYTVLQTGIDNTLTIALRLKMLEGVTSSDTDINGTGDYQAFMSALCVEADTVQLALLQRVEQGAREIYNVVAIEGNLHLTADTPTAVHNTAVPSFYDSGSYGCYTTVTIDPLDWTDVAGEYVWTDDEENRNYVSLMAFIPIWYVDDGTAQDAQKDCFVTISECNVTY